MPSLCENLKTSYEHLQRLTTEFTAKYDAVKDAGDLREVRVLRKELEAARDALLEQLALFIVPDAKNLHHKALLEAGLDEAKTKEQQEMRVDIRKEIQRQLAVYRQVKNKEGHPLLEDWVKDIVENKSLIYAAAAKDHTKIAERIKEGMIPVVMPGRAIQERTWEDVLRYLRPIWIRNGKPEALNEKGNYLSDNYKNRKKMTKGGFFKHIPDRPYLVWVKPTQGLDPVTLNKSFDEQQALYADMVERHPNLYDQADLTPTEYVALQAMATSQVYALFRELTGGTKEPTTIKPLDCGYTSYTRFLSAGPLSGGHVPYAYFNAGLRRVGVGFNISEASDEGGFRPAARS